MKISRARSSIEHVFAHLKGQFPSLTNMRYIHLPEAVKHVEACILLYNFCILNNEEVENVE